MLREIRKLTAIQTCNLFGINEVRHSSDSGKKGKFALMCVLWAFVGLVLVAYVCLLVFGLHTLGMGQLVPAYLFAVTSVVIFAFGIFKAGGTLFARSSFEAFSALPVRRSSVVISRFLTMYIYDLLLAVGIMVPGLVVHAVLAPQGVMFWVAGLLGALLLPMLPLTAASLVGALVAALTSRMKHKGIFSALFTILLVMGILGAEAGLTSSADQLTGEAMGQLAASLGDAIGQIYPPALWYGAAVMENDVLSLLVLAALSIAVLLLLVALVTPGFGTLCSAINGKSAKGAYKLGSLKNRSQLGALYRLEFRRYFSSGIWISNTLIGYVMLLVLCASTLFTDLSPLTDMLGGSDRAALLVPCAFGMLMSMSAITSSAISMEGKQWWMTTSLPISSGTLVNAKLLMNLTFALPTWAVCMALLYFGLRPGAAAFAVMCTGSLAFVIFAVVTGLRINAAMPVLQWDNDARVVKQSGAVGLTMLAGAVTSIAAAAVQFVLPIPAEITVIAVSVLLLALSAAMHAGCTRLKLNKLGAEG